MDWLNNLLPEDFNYWIVVSVVLAVWSVYQYAEKHGLTLFKKHVLTYGHEPDGKVLVPKEAVVATPTVLAAPVVDESLPWNRSKKV